MRITHARTNSGGTHRRAGAGQRRVARSNGGAAYGGDGMSELRDRVIAYNAEVKAALQAVYNGLNQGQRKKLLRNPVIRAMFERYGVEIDE